MLYEFNHCRGPTLPLQIFLDESLLDVLEHLDNPMEDVMFNPVEVQDKTFTVEFIKQDGTHGKVTGKLVAPNYEGNADDLMAYCAGLLNQDRVPVWTDKGWRSFYSSKVFHFKIED